MKDSNITPGHVRAFQAPLRIPAIADRDSN